MGLTKGQIKYIQENKLNLPVDKRTRAYQQFLKKRGWIDEQYEEYVKEVIRNHKKLAKDKMKKKVKQLEKEVQTNKRKEQQYTQIKNNNHRNKLLYMSPTEKGWKSYYNYTIWNDFPDNVPITSLSRQYVDENLSKEPKYEPPAISVEEIENFFSYFQFSTFLKEQIKKMSSIKITYSAEFDATDHGVNVEWGFTTEAHIVRNLEEIFQTFQQFKEKYYRIVFNQTQRYIFPYHLIKFTIHIDKINPLSGSSYVDLPLNIKNKQAIINIKNKDNLCFAYSVLAHLHPVKVHPERPNHYIQYLNELNYNQEDMPMDVNKIRYFEEKNRVRINVFTCDDKGNITSLKSCSNRCKTEYPLINLFYYQQHYSYIKNLNALFNCKQGIRVCPYCCEFKTGSDGDNAMERHIGYCISGQRVNMPKEGENILKFNQYKNLIPSPVRIYADFEAFNDASKKFKSKNGKTVYNAKQSPASFKILIVSDICIRGYKECNKKYYKSILYKGLDADKVFVEELEKLGYLYKKILEAQEKNKETIIMNEEQKRQHQECKCCHLCNYEFDTKNNKVRHHNHNTGEFHSTICNNCNIQIKDRIKIPVMFHNLNYDKNIFMKYLQVKEQEPTIIPSNSEKFKAFSVGFFSFIDTFSFMSSSLEKLMKNLPDEDKHFLKELVGEDKFKYVNMKGYFPYDWFDVIEKFKLSTSEIKREYFDSILYKTKLKDEEWNYIQELIKENNLKTFEDFHDFYLNIDVNGLADVFENFRKTSIEYYKLDPCHYTGAPAFAWNAMLLKTGVKLELLTDVEMYLFFERGIRGGQSVIFQKHSIANNKYISGYDKDKKTIYISYLDANNLYGEAMSHKLPVSDFKWFDSFDESLIYSYDEKTSDIGYVLEVDLEYPEELHDLHNDYPLAPEKVQYKSCSKLCGTLNDKKNYIVHISNLQFYLKHGLKLTKIHRGISFKQSNWLKKWIDINTEYRTKAKNDFEKDYFKLMNNSVFGKTMENVRGRVDVKICRTEDKKLKWSSKPNYKNGYLLGEDVMLLNLSKTDVKLNKPIYAGFSILDYSKLHMFKFHYEVMKPKYGDKIKLLMTDTDSLVYEIETEDFYMDMKEMKEHYDLSEFDKNSFMYDGTNKKVIGKFKDEYSLTFIDEFLGVRPKCYALNTVKDGEKKKLKGVPKVVVENEITLNDYRECVVNNKSKTIEGINGIKSHKLQNFMITYSKKCLENADDKRIWQGVYSKAIGHYSSK